VTSGGALARRCLQVAIKGFRGMDMRRASMHNDRRLYGFAV